jgi:3-oxoacyl-[acyl-carrier-protein] synthase-3
MSKNVFITALENSFLVNRSLMRRWRAHLGLIGGKRSRLKSRILKQNGIQTRHYAIDRNGHVNYWNSDLASLAVRDAIAKSHLTFNQVELLTAATSQSDLLAPGFASMVHGSLGLPPCEIASLHGICASGVAALNYAFLSLRSGQQQSAAVCASEFTSRFFRPGLFEETRVFKETGRWPSMRSSSAGCFPMVRVPQFWSRTPNPDGLSLRIDWIDLISYADRLDVLHVFWSKQGRGK